MDQVAWQAVHQRDEMTARVNFVDEMEAFEDFNALAYVVGEILKRICMASFDRRTVESCLPMLVRF